MNRHVNKADRVEKEVPLCANKQLNLGTTKGVLFPQIPVEEFGDYVSRCHANVNKDFSSQYTVSTLIINLQMVLLQFNVLFL